MASAQYNLNDYIFDDSFNIHVSPDRKGIQYADGSEDYVTRVIKTAVDVSLASQELKTHIQDWPSRYHLSPERANILNSVSELFDKESTVLELGSGCGAITRWLAEHFAHVDALEGSLPRAIATKERVRDLGNVDVYFGDILGTAFNKKYDIITLIGVLEYLPALVDDPAGPEVVCTEILRKLSGSLKEGGILVIAIENRLGLKYLSGCTEDHTGRLFDGLIGYPDKSAVTFSRRVMKNIVAEAGLTNIQLYHAYPDYKLTSTLIRECEDAERLNLYSWVSTPFEDYSGNRVFLWPENLVLKSMAEAGLFWDVSNSFLVIASSQNTNLSTPWIIKKTNTHWFQHSCYHHEITLHHTPSGYIVKRTALGEGSIPDQSQLAFELQDQPYINGELLSLTLMKALLKREAGQELESALRLISTQLLELGSKDYCDADGYSMIKGDYIDYTFWNLIVESGNTVHFIDSKWRLNRDIPLDFILFRNLFYFYRSVAPYTGKTQAQFVIDAIQALYPGYTGERFEKNILLENEFQSIITGRDVKIVLNDTLTYTVVGQLDVLTAQVSEKDTKICELESLSIDDGSSIKEMIARVSRLERSIAEKDAHIKNIEALEKQKSTQLAIINQSLIWRTLNSYQAFLDRFLPNGTRRRRVYDLGFASERILINEGPVSLSRHIWAKLFHLQKQRQSLLYQKNDYDRWIANNEPDQAKLKEYRREIMSFSYRPLISIVVPVFNPKMAWIEGVIRSVTAQVYPNWELCIADASTDQTIRNYLQRESRADSRIKLKLIDTNRGIVGNSNEALALATGEYVGLMDHDDELSPDALYWVVKLLQSHREADMIYSDEDKIDLDGRRVEPFFKPEWSPDLFLSCMYTCHLGVYRKTLIDAIGGFRDGYDGSQDYDLVLRVIERTHNIYHIPRVLYHWRKAPGSTATSSHQKNYAQEAAKRALTDYLKRNGIAGEVLDGAWHTSYRVKRSIAGQPLVSIIIPTRDHDGVLKRCIDSILAKTTYDNFEILIVDNGSVEQATLEYFKSLQSNPKIKILNYPEPFNFSAINNFAVKHSSGSYLLFLNNDTEAISDEWLSAMLEHCQRKDVGAVGSKLIYPNDTIQHAGIILGINGGTGDSVAGHSHKCLARNDNGYFGRVGVIHNLSGVTAACLMVRRDVFDSVGGFDEKLKIAFNDVDLCLKIREAGYLIVYTPYAELYHHESLSRGYEDSPEKQKRFGEEIRYIRARWGKIIDSGDPYYSPNLSLRCEDFRIKE